MYDLEEDLTQKQPTNQYPTIEKEMKQQLTASFSKVHRGYFNWDIKYAKHRSATKKVDHSFDRAINDKPQMKVSHSVNKTTVAISPVSDKLIYKLQGSVDGKTWKDLDKYTCRTAAEKYVFPSFLSDSNNKIEYRVQTANHFGLPLYDGFSLDDAYKTGPLSMESNSALMNKTLPLIDGFLPVADVSGGEQIQIINKNLKYGDFPKEGGALQLKSKSQDIPAYLTRYFIEPQSRGKVYASMLVQFQAQESESIGEINWLVQNGWNGPTEKQISLSFQNDGIYLKQADALKEQDSINWLAKHDNKVVLVLLEFDLGTIGQDNLNIYINPDNRNNMTPTASYKGEFTFDRLHFKMNGRTSGTMTVDEIHVGRRLEDVMY